MPTFRAYKQQRPTRGLYDTITFYHPSFGYVRLVDKQFFPKTLGGQTYTPARFEIEESQQSGTPVIRRDREAWAAFVGHQSADEAVEGRSPADGHHGHAADLRQRRRVGANKVLATVRQDGGYRCRLSVGNPFCYQPSE